MIKSAKDLAEDMLLYKESLGCKRKTYEFHLNAIAEYIDKQCPTGEMISLKDVILPWCVQRDTESPSGLRKRLATVREFTKYLYAVDRCDGVLSLDILPKAHSSFTPYIFTDDELIALFDAAENIKPEVNDLFSEDVIGLIFKLIYFCGLRPNEGRELRRNDFDHKAHTLFIRHNKSGRKRIIPIEDELAVLCEKYLRERDAMYPFSDMFFPSPSGEAYSAKWLARRFLKVWKTAFPDSKAPVRVYDLRHRFATAVMTEWLERGEDLYTCLPYLSAYMGHAEFSSTACYVHLLPERLMKSSAINWELFSKILPEVESYE